MAEYFRAKAYRRVTKTTPRPDAEAGPYNEPAEAADWAEEWLTSNGVPDESFVDLYFNGESNIHTSIYLLRENGEQLFGVLNSAHARWPIHYMEGDGMEYAQGEEPFGRDTDEWLPGDSDEDETDDEADQADITDMMKGSEDEKPSDKGGDDSEEMPEPDEDENADEEDEDMDESGEGESGEPDEDGGDGDEEKEVPRMTIFGKFRGPKGWRKRAETNPDDPTNVFAVKFGVLDPERRTSAQQERNSRVEIRFIERDSRRDAGELRIRIPDGVTIRDDGKWLVAEIPYEDRDEDED